MAKHQHGGSERPQTIEERLALVEKVVVSVAREHGTDNVIGGGFGSMSDHLESITHYLQGIEAQMRPLRNLGVPKPKLTREQRRRLSNLIEACKPPKWSALQSLSFDKEPVRFIGESMPDADFNDRSQP